MTFASDEPPALPLGEVDRLVKKHGLKEVLIVLADYCTMRAERALAQETLDEPRWRHLAKKLDQLSR